MASFPLILYELDLHTSSVINRIEASTLFVAVKKLGIEERLSMDLACMAMKQKLDKYQKRYGKSMLS